MVGGGCDHVAVIPRCIEHGSVYRHSHQSSRDGATYIDSRIRPTDLEHFNAVQNASSGRRPATARRLHQPTDRHDATANPSLINVFHYMNTNQLTTDMVYALSTVRRLWQKSQQQTASKMPLYLKTLRHYTNNVLLLCRIAELRT